MEVTLLNKSFKAYREVFHQTRIIQESTESVVPDTDDDMGRVAGVESEVYLKSKDLTSRGVSVSGEVVATAICINEAGDRTGFVRLSRQFSMEYEVPGIDPAMAARIELKILSADVRLLNSRKLSACFDISGELSCFVKENVETEYSLPEGSRGVYTMTQETELLLPNAVCEKTCAVTEQFSFPTGKPVPSRIICGSTSMNVTDTQLVGSRVIIKGRAEIRLLYISEGADYPIQAEFSAPFSQLVDIGEETMENASVHIELTNAYYDLIDSVTGEKALSAEVHGVIQLLTRTKRTISYISDLYSNYAPTEITKNRTEYSVVTDNAEEKLSVDERIRVSDDCSDVLWVGMSVGRVSRENEKISATVFADIIYRDAQGNISSVRRSIECSSESRPFADKLTACGLTDIYLRPDGEFIDVRASVILSGPVSESIEVIRVTGLTINEEAPYDKADYPSVTMVRWEGESLWELAKNYHSSVELIEQYNDEESFSKSKMLLIARAL